LFIVRKGAGNFKKKNTSDRDFCLSIESVEEEVRGYQDYEASLLNSKEKVRQMPEKELKKYNFFSSCGRIGRKFLQCSRSDGV
jgi:hypothetical protein